MVSLKTNMNSKMKIGFIGLGLMGNPMVKNIIKSGFPVSVYNRSSKRTEEFKKMGIKIRKSPKELAKDSDIVISMVTAPKDVKKVMLGKDGVLEGSKNGLIVIDMSTIGPKAAIEIRKGLEKHGVDFLDAPVTGSVMKAIPGELTIFIGGKENIYKKAKPVLLAIGKDLNYMGPIGTGQAVKLINNHLVGSSLIALAEGMILADLFNLPREKVAKALENAYPVSVLMKLKMPNMIKNEFPTAFSVANMHKDLKLALEETKNPPAGGKRTNLPMLKLVEKLYKKGLLMNLGNADNSAILKVLEKNK